MSECADSGVTLVVEMPDQRLLAIQPLEPQEEDFLLASNPARRRAAAACPVQPRFTGFARAAVAGPPFNGGFRVITEVARPV